jgi:NAD(P) transhydrogenase subunit alpha
VKIAVLKETAEGERRVAASAETVKKFIGLGAAVAVEGGAGATASVSDQAFADAGATICDRASAPMPTFCSVSLAQHRRASPV